MLAPSGHREKGARQYRRRRNRAGVGHRRWRNNVTEVRHDTGAQFHCAQVRTATQSTLRRNPRSDRSIICVDPAIVGLKEPQRKPVIEKWQVIIHTAASRQRRSPLIWIVVARILRIWAAQSAAAN